MNPRLMDTKATSPTNSGQPSDICSPATLAIRKGPPSSLTERRPVMIWPRALILVLAVPAFWWLLREPGAGAVYAVTFLLSALSSINAAAIIVAVSVVVRSESFSEVR